MSKGQYIEGKLYDTPAQTVDLPWSAPAGEEMPYRAKLITELAHRMKEFHDFDPRASAVFHHYMARVFRVDPIGWHLGVSVLAGNTESDLSLAALGEREVCSKQNVHQSHNRALDALEERLPRFTLTIRSILGKKKPNRGRANQDK